MSAKNDVQRNELQFFQKLYIFISFIFFQAISIFHFRSSHLQFSERWGIPKKRLSFENNFKIVEIRRVLVGQSESLYFLHYERLEQIKTTVWPLLG